MIDRLIGLAGEPAMQFAMAAGVLAGLVRGFSGFGAGMVFVPAAGATLDPRLVVPMMWMLDGLPALPIVVPALKRCDWRVVLPVLAGLVPAVPLGVAALAHLDRGLLRWGVSLLILALVGVLATGLRYHGRPKAPFSASVGAIAGFCGGAAQVSGPPVLVYWLGGPDPAAKIRDNVIAFFACASLVSGAAYMIGGLITLEAAMRALLVAPGYALALVVGARLFGKSSETTFRRLAHLLIALAAISGLPVFDGTLR